MSSEIPLAEAIAAAKLAVADAPNDQRLKLDLANLLIKSGNLDAALSAFDEALELNGKAADIHMQKSIVLGNKISMLKPPHLPKQP